MREICQSGSEGGGIEPIGTPYPYQSDPAGGRPVNSGLISQAGSPISEWPVSSGMLFDKVGFAGCRE